MAVVEYAGSSGPVPQDLATQAEEFRELLFDACRLRVRCDVPVAMSLSGGLDSSSVSLLARGGSRRPRH